MGLLDGLIDIEGQTKDTIQDYLEKISAELGCSFKDFFIMIKPVTAEFEMKLFIYKMENGVPKPVRETSLKEILNT